MARMRSSLVAAAATIAALAAPTTASAERVTDCGDLQQTLDDFTVVTIAEGLTCSGSWELPDGRITELSGEGETGATLSGAQEQGPRVQILHGFNVGASRISNLTFVDGRAASDNGGAIQIEGDSPVTIEDNRFFLNDAEEGEGGGAGGAVSLELDNQVFAPEARGESPPVVLRDNAFGGLDEGGDSLGNDADAEGGAVAVSAFFRHVIVEGNTFESNDAPENIGGGLALLAAVSTLSDNTFVHNESGNRGGGAAVATCASEITGNVFDDNLVQVEDGSLDGGGLYLDGSLCPGDIDLARGGQTAGVTQSDNLFVDNRITGEFSSGDGAGEFVTALSVVSTNDRFVRNSIEGTNSGRGGGLAYFGGELSFAARNLVAVGNRIAPGQPTETVRGLPVLDAQGGALYLRGSELRVADSTVTGNDAASGGGIAGLQQVDQAGVAPRGDIGGDELTLHNSIVHGNTNETGDDVAGFRGRDVRSSDTCVEGAPAQGAGNLCVDPKLVPDDADDDEGEVDQGASSPTVDAGDNTLVDSDLTTDYSLAGDARVLDGKVDIGADEFKAATVEPQPQPQPQPQPTAQTPAATPPAAGGVQGAQQRSCRSKRVFRIRIRIPRGKKALSATVRVNNKKVKVVRGKRLRAPVRLRGLPKGRFTVRITVRLANGKKLTGVRRYHTCIPKRPGDGPPKL